mgnify:CR=1 FL=1
MAAELEPPGAGGSAKIPTSSSNLGDQFVSGVHGKSEHTEAFQGMQKLMPRCLGQNIT